MHAKLLQKFSQDASHLGAGEVQFSRRPPGGGAGLCQDSGKFLWDCWGWEIPKPELTGTETGTLGPLVSPSKGWCPQRVAEAPSGMKPCPLSPSPSSFHLQWLL